MTGHVQYIELSSKATFISWRSNFQFPYFLAHRYSARINTVLIINWQLLNLHKDSKLLKVL